MTAPAYSLDDVARVRESGRLVDAVAVAAFLGVDRGWVYEHAGELGGRRLGSGPRARLRFSMEDVQGWLDSCSATRGTRSPDSSPVKPVRRRRREVGLGTSVVLLPIKGRRGAS
jgi:hypothetical protein